MRITIYSSVFPHYIADARVLQVWFSYHRSQISPSHSSCPISCNIVNLEPSQRYRASNLLLVGVMPGPKEQNPEEIQSFMHIFVNELLRLWKHGIRVRTRRFPGGRLVRVALVGIVCDKPAAHKMGGYASHSHRLFCTLCWIEQVNLSTADAFREGGESSFAVLHCCVLCQY